MKLETNGPDNGFLASQEERGESLLVHMPWVTCPEIELQMHGHHGDTQATMTMSPAEFITFTLRCQEFIANHLTSGSVS